jgi:uncharacterized protein (UPF0335 family)
MDDLAMAIETPDGTKPGPFTRDELEQAQGAFGKAPLKPDPDFEAAREKVYRVIAAELRQFVERFERLDAEKTDIADLQKEVMAEAKGRGYNTRALRQIIRERKRDKDDLAEEQAVLDLYREALGM